MKSLHKVYKSVNVTLGQKKSIEYNQQYVVRDEEPDDIQSSKEEIEIDEQLEIQNKINEAEEECERLLSQAKEEANLIIAEAYEDSKNILEKAKEDGYKEGLSIGQREGLEEYSTLIDEAKQLKQGVYQFKRETASQLEEDIIHLVIDSVKKIINIRLEENNELILNIVKTAIDKCTFTESLTIRVSEEDFESVNANVNQIYMMTEGIDQISVKIDKFLKSGSLIIDTISGKIDAGVETQINQIEHAFKELLRSE